MTVRLIEYGKEDDYSRSAGCCGGYWRRRALEDWAGVLGMKVFFAVLMIVQIAPLAVGAYLLMR